MPDPKQHADQRGWIETILRYIPGFRGYLEKEYRRESDALARSHIATRLATSKRGVTQYQRELLDLGRLDDLTALERVVTSLDTLVNRIQGDVRGYSGFFDFVKIDEAVLDRIYEHDMQLISDVEALVKQTEALTPVSAEPRQAAAQLQRQVEGLGEKYGLRTKILTGLD